jgi:hypothetical protein
MGESLREFRLNKIIVSNPIDMNCIKTTIMLFFHTQVIRIFQGILP